MQVGQVAKSYPPIKLLKNRVDIFAKKYVNFYFLNLGVKF